MKSRIENNTYIVTFDNLKEFMSHSVDETPPNSGHRGNDSDHREIFRETEDSWRYGSEQTLENFLEKRSDPTKGKTLCKDDVSKTMVS